MPAIGSLTINDGTANRTFVPKSSLNGLTSWGYQPSGFDSVEALRRWTQSLNLPKPGSEVARAKFRMVQPCMDSSTGLKIGELVADISVVIPKKATRQERNDFYFSVASAFGIDTVVGAAIIDLENVW